MLKAAKKIFSQIRGVIIKDKKDQTLVMSSVPNESTESSSPAPLSESPPPNTSMTEPPPPAEPISDSPPLELPRLETPLAEGMLPKSDPL